jgi:hypothetical protein
VESKAGIPEELVEDEMVQGLPRTKLNFVKARILNIFKAIF